MFVSRHCTQRFVSCVHLMAQAIQFSDGVNSDATPLADDSDATPLAAIPLIVNDRRRI